MNKCPICFAELKIKWVIEAAIPVTDQGKILYYASRRVIKKIKECICCEFKEKING